MSLIVTVYVKEGIVMASDRMLSQCSINLTCGWAEYALNHNEGT